MVIFFVQCWITFHVLRNFTTVNTVNQLYRLFILFALPSIYIWIWLTLTFQYPVNGLPTSSFDLLEFYGNTEARKLPSSCFCSKSPVFLSLTHSKSPSLYNGLAYKVSQDSTLAAFLLSSLILLFSVTLFRNSGVLALLQASLAHPHLRFALLFLLPALAGSIATSFKFLQWPHWTALHAYTHTETTEFLTPISAPFFSFSL